MKLYQIIMEVPDDFIPEEMQLTGSYKAPIEVYSEGFIGSASFVKCTEEHLEPTSEVAAAEVVQVEDVTIEAEEGTATIQTEETKETSDDSTLNTCGETDGQSEA